MKPYWSAFAQNVLGPVSRRLGSTAGGALMALGATQELSVQVDRVWVTDITYIKTHEGWSYLAVVIDLFSRRVVGWSMQSRMTSDLALQALLSAVWRRKPRHRVLIHSDQGSQFTGNEWQSFLSKHTNNGMLSPVDYEMKQQKMNKAGV